MIKKLLLVLMIIVVTSQNVHANPTDDVDYCSGSHAQDVFTLLDCGTLDDVRAYAYKLYFENKKLRQEILKLKKQKKSSKKNVKF